MSNSSNKYRLLVVNPNANPAVTKQVQESTDSVLGSDWHALAINPAQSPFSIQSQYDRELAEPSAIEILRSNPDYDAYVMACFDDIAVNAGRQFLDSPIINPVDASIAMARLVASRFSIVTTVEAMVPGIRTHIKRLRACEECTVRAAGIGVAEAAAATDEILDTLYYTVEQACSSDGAEAIILGSGGLTGMAGLVSERFGIPVIDSVEAAVLLATALKGCLPNYSRISTRS
ncbi:aspartate/glutamate racemase family protein [Veronia pacifica]|uniref:Asp/Glu/hydantoin racemase n=1 Tax=Veronia pacifica TaxID=1080227 RepID=A0A1C3EIP8_9GAMM|nr:aspartate/glutamate racemase family protein [Veronia pacifica]ODA33089.1 hypothetical protein A8L45_11655 [Veronia pacifica]